MDIFNAVFGARWRTFGAHKTDGYARCPPIDFGWRRLRKNRWEIVPSLTPGGATPAPTGVQEVVDNRAQEIAEALSHGGGTRTEAILAARAA
jgi:hypothetical protein